MAADSSTALRGDALCTPPLRGGFALGAPPLRGGFAFHSGPAINQCSAAPLRLAIAALGTRVELVLMGDDHATLRAAGEAALAEVSWWHARLSRFAADSDVAFIAREAHVRPIRLDPDLFDLIAMCEQVRAATHGAFDIRVAHAMDHVQRGSTPSAPPAQIQLDPARRTIFAPGPVPLRLDLGSVGKGFALDRAVAALREAGVTNAFIHAGTSSVAAIGPGAQGDGWRVRVAHDEAVSPAPGSSEAHAEAAPAQSPGPNLTPRNTPTNAPLHVTQLDLTQPDLTQLHLTLLDEAMSVSSPTARWSDPEPGSDRASAHILDPRTGTLVVSPRTAVVIASLARDDANAGARCEAWSTSLAVLGASANCPADLSTHVRDAGTEWRTHGRPRSVIASPPNQSVSPHPAALEVV